MASLNEVVAVLTRACQLESVPAPATHPFPPFERGRQLLEDNARMLFGPDPAARQVRIMVTLPTEAARNSALVRELVLQGMDCARINCAHDDPEAWQAMIAHVRRAGAQTSRDCRILMDLAGHKLRTGPTAPQPAALHLQVERDCLGRPVAPAQVLVTTRDGSISVLTGLPAVRLSDDTLPAFQHADRLEFRDTRGKARVLVINRQQSPTQWSAQAPKSAYLAGDTEFEWRRAGSAGSLENIGTLRSMPLAEQPGAIRLQTGDLLYLTRSPESAAAAPDRGPEESGPDPARIGCLPATVLDHIAPGEGVWLNDGRIGARVEGIDDIGALLRITSTPPKGANLRGDQGINFPDSKLNLPSLSERDIQDLDFVCAHADLVGFSFVESAQDMQQLHAALDARGADKIGVVAKIETKRAVRNLPQILFAGLGQRPLGVMIARGDLAVELGGERLAEIQEEILWLCEACHVPVIWATQVLESLVKRNVVSRPELTDAAMSGRAECVMLNKGPHVVRAVTTLDDILQRMQAHQYKKGARLRALHW